MKEKSDEEREVPRYRARGCGHELVNKKSLKVRWPGNRGLPHLTCSYLCCWQVGPSVMATASWILSLSDGGSEEEPVSFMFRVQVYPRQKDGSTLEQQNDLQPEILQRGESPQSEVTTWNVTPKGLWGNPEDALEFPLGFQWNLKLMQFSSKSAKRPLLTFGVHFEKADSNIAGKY